MFSLARAGPVSRTASSSLANPICLSGHARFAAKQAPKGKKSVVQRSAGFKNKDTSKKKKGDGEESEGREKVSIKMAFETIPLAQRSHPLMQVESRLLTMPTLKKGGLSSKLVGKTVQMPTENSSPAKAFGLPRNVLVDFRLLSSPCSIVRETTLSLTNKLDKVQSSESSRWVLSGPAGCGKSYLLLQALAHCAVNDWIVLYIPRAHRLVDSSTLYQYDAQSQTYLQPNYSMQTLQRFLIANAQILESMRLTKSIRLGDRGSIPSGTSLKSFVEIGVKEEQYAPTILTEVLEQLGSQNKHPVLLAVDSLQTLYGKSQYRNQHYERIRTYHLSLPRLLLEYASGQRVFKRGAFLGAISVSQTEHPIPTELKLALNLNPDQPIGPYTDISHDLMEYTKGLQSIPVPEKLNFQEAASLFELWRDDLSLHSYETDELFLSKLSESGGNAREFVHRGLLASLSP